MQVSAEGNLLPYHLIKLRFQDNANRKLFPVQLHADEASGVWPNSKQ